MKLTTCQGSAQCLNSGRGPLSWLISAVFGVLRCRLGANSHSGSRSAITGPQSA